MTYNFEKQKELLLSFITNGEKEKSDFKLGLEMEHFILWKDTLGAVPYTGDQGISGILHELSKGDWSPLYEGQHLLGAVGKEANLSLEPGGQLEISIFPYQSLEKIDQIYRKFLQQLIPILEQRKMVLMATGYQPESRIEEIELLPKKRYYYMFKYFSDKGLYAHNMMKGTASTQINLDYSDQEDYRKKVRVAAFLSPLVYTIFDNSPFFKGKVYAKTSLRSLIWYNCDRERCGLPAIFFQNDYGYADYAEYLLAIPPIIIKRGQELLFTAAKKLAEVFDPADYTEQEIWQFFTMVFPDIRTKKYIEIRMGDSLPYPYNLAYLAFWKGLLYDQANLQKIDDRAKEFLASDLLRLRQEMIEHGPQASYGRQSIFELMEELLIMAKRALNPSEKKYLAVLIELVAARQTPRSKSLARLAEGKSKALRWCQLTEGG